MSAALQIANGSFDEQKHEYQDAAGVVRPSVTQILESVGLTDLDGIPEDTLERKRALGDAVHFATAIIDRANFFNGPELDWDTVHEKTVPYILAWESFMKQTGFVPEEVEHGGICTVNGMHFGFTRDRVGKMPGSEQRFVLEIKCSYKEEKAWRWQLAAYHKTISQKGMITRVAVQLKPDATFKVHPYDNPRDWDVFNWALCLTYAKINEGLPWREDRDVKSNGGRKNNVP